MKLCTNLHGGTALHVLLPSRVWTFSERDGEQFCCEKATFVMGLSVVDAPKNKGSDRGVQRHLPLHDQQHVTEYCALSELFTLYRALFG